MLNSIAAATLLQILSLAVSLLDRIALSGLLLRVWGLGVFEDWSLLIAGAGTLSLFDFGLHMTFANGYVSAYQSGNLKLFQRRVAVSIWISLAIMTAGTTALLFLFATSHWQGFFLVSTLTGMDGKAVLILSGLAVLLQTASCSITTLYRAQRRFSRGLIFENSLSVARLAVVAAAAGLRFDPVSTALVYLLATAAFFLLIIPFDLRRTLNAIGFTPAVPCRAELGSIARLAPWYYAQHAANVLLLNVPLLALPHVAETRGAIAGFIIVRTLINSVRQLLYTVSNSIAVELSTHHASVRANSADGAHLARSTRLITVTNGAVLGSLFWMAGPFIEMWSGGVLRIETTIAIALGMGSLLTGPFVILSNYLNYIGNARIGVISRLVQTGISLGMSFLLLKPLGALGIAIGLSAGEAVGGGAVYLWAMAHSHPAEYRVWSYLSSTMAGLLPPLVFGFELQVFEFGSALQTCAFRGALLMPVAAASIFFFGLSRADRSFAGRAIQHSKFMRRVA